MNLSKLEQYANDHQLEVLRAVQKHGSASAAAKKLGKDRRGIDRTIDRVKVNAAKQGYSPEHDMNQTVPDGYLVKGVSTLYNEDGGIKAQWVKSLIDPEKQGAMYQAAISAMSSDIKKTKPIKRLAKAVNSDLLSLYIITDYHLGMLAWGEETGADWDIQIAEDLLFAWFQEAIKSAPPSETAILGQLGDLLHYDGMEAVTPSSGHALDADTRFAKVVRVAIRAFRRIVTQLLNKHENVHIIHAEGNHDLASSIWLREMFAALYEDEPRVTVDQSPDPYYCYEFGDVSLFVHHGHKKKPESIDEVFAAKFREVFGRTKHSYGHMGHMHHKKAIETTLMTIEQHRTLASPDAYASRGGWMSGRGSSVITYHRNHGEVSRTSITPEMLS